MKTKLKEEKEKGKKKSIALFEAILATQDEFHVQKFWAKQFQSSFQVGNERNNSNKNCVKMLHRNFLFL